MRWQKLGILKLPFQGIRNSHTQIPVTLIDTQDELCILYASRDVGGISRTFKCTLDIETLKISKIQDRPILDLGSVGNFDDSGIMPTWILKHDDSYFLYYIGWNKKVSVPYQNSIGLALSADGVTFKKLSNGPILDRSIHDSCFVGTACVLKEDDWRMWYLSCSEWIEHNGKLEPRYHIKYANSSDGVNWNRQGVIAIDFASESEGGIAKASVIKIKDTYHMWFCHRGTHNYRFDKKESYRIGYASSVDGITWLREDSLAGIDIENEGWDSEMICYPHVFEYKNETYMLYNGNGFGYDGIGIAKLIP
jgi:hypothetical protein